MSLIKFLKPTKWKVIGGLIAAIVVVLYKRSIELNACAAKDCIPWFDQPIPWWAGLDDIFGLCCNTSGLRVVSTYAVYAILPFVIGYIIISLISRTKKTKNKA